MEGDDQGPGRGLALVSERQADGAGRTGGLTNVAALLGRALFGSIMWAAAAVAFVGPRDGHYAGGSLHLAYLRMAGTVWGGVAGLGVVAACGGSMAGAAPLALLAAWVLLSGLARGSPRHAYGAMVAQFTPYILLEYATQTDVGAYPQFYPLFRQPKLI